MGVGAEGVIAARPRIAVSEARRRTLIMLGDAVDTVAELASPASSFLESSVRACVGAGRRR